MNRQIVLIAHNIRSSHNVGSLLRTSDGLGVVRVWLTGYTPYPAAAQDTRMPHIANKVDSQISKIALGAEKTQAWSQTEDVIKVLAELQSEGFMLAALEQTETATNLAEFQPPERIALIVGREVQGIEPEVLEQASTHLHIPMFGAKESFNVVQAAAMALYHCRFY